MADIRINSLPTTAVASSSDDFLALDGTTNGTRKLNAYSPTFGGNVTVSGGKVLISYPSSSQARVSFGGAHFDANSSYASYIRGYSSSATTAGLDFYTTYGSSVLALSLSEQGNATFGGNLTVSGNVAMAKTKSVTFSGISVLTADDGIALPNGTKDNVVTFGTYVDGSTNGGYRWRTSTGTNLATLTNVGDFALSGNLTVSGGTITGGTSGLSLASGGTNQNITLTPSGTGTNVLNKGLSVLNTIGQFSGTGAPASGAGVEVGMLGTTQGLIFAYNRTTSAALPLSLQHAGGNLLIGTTTDGGQRLQVAGSASITGTVSIGTQLNFDTGNAAGIRTIALGSTYNSGRWDILNGSTAIGSISAAGGFASNVGFRAPVGSGPTTADYGWANSSGFYSPSANVVSLTANNSRVASWSTTAMTLDYTTASSSTTTGALVVSGGVGVAGVVNTGDVIVTQGGTASTPANAFATGTAGTIRWDASYIYVCTAANTWKRVAIAAW